MTNYVLNKNSKLFNDNVVEVLSPREFWHQIDLLNCVDLL